MTLYMGLAIQDEGQDIPDPAEMLGPIESVDPVKPVVEMLLKLIPALKNDRECACSSAAFRSYNSYR